MENLEEKLIKGHTISFESENDMMELSFMKTLGGSMEFIIMLNCKIIKMTKTFKPFLKKVKELIESRELTLSN